MLCKILVPEATWIYNGQTVIQPTANFHTIITPDGKASLRIDQVRPENAGEYKIRITNPKGLAEKSVRLDVICKSSENSRFYAIYALKYQVS